MSGYGNLFDEMMGGKPRSDQQRAADDLKSAADRLGKTKPRDAPLPQIRGKRIDGVLYVNAADVADALETQVKTGAERLIKKLRG